MVYQPKICPNCQSAGDQLEYLWHHYKNGTKHIMVRCKTCNKPLGNAPQIAPYLGYITGVYASECKVICDKKDNDIPERQALPLHETTMALSIETHTEIARLKGLKYETYLKSKHWALTRKKLLKERGSFCENCNQRNCLDVHHVHYETRGEETSSDLIVLCHKCHGQLHTLLRRLKQCTRRPF